MKLLFKQRLFSWLDSYDVYDEAGNTVFTVEGAFSWGHCLHVLDASGAHVGTLKEVVLSFLPCFEVYLGERLAGCIHKEFTFFQPRFVMDMGGWQVEGSLTEWDYSILDAQGFEVAAIHKELFHWTDTYVLEVDDPRDALQALLVVLAIDAEKCSRND